jgi:hypothetical protein
VSLPQAIEDKESKKTRASLKKLCMLEVPRRSMAKGGDLQPSLYRLSVGIWADVLRRHPLISLHPCGSPVLAKGLQARAFRKQNHGWSLRSMVSNARNGLHSVSLSLQSLG